MNACSSGIPYQEPSASTTGVAYIHPYYEEKSDSVKKILKGQPRYFTYIDKIDDKNVSLISKARTVRVTSGQHKVLIMCLVDRETILTPETQYISTKAFHMNFEAGKHYYVQIPYFSSVIDPNICEEAWISRKK